MISRILEQDEMIGKGHRNGFWFDFGLFAFRGLPLSTATAHHVLLDRLWACLCYVLRFIVGVVILGCE